MRWTLAFLLLTCSTLSVHAQPGTLDASFGQGGVVVTSFGQYTGPASVVAVQADGKIILGGSLTDDDEGANATMVRYLPNGEIDSTFADNGRLTAPCESSGVALWRAIQSQPDGAILGLDECPSITIKRFLANGAPDLSFGLDGSVQPAFVPNDMVLQADGTILVVGKVQGGSTDVILCRYTADGEADEDFGSGGMTITPVPGAQSFEVLDLNVQADGKIVLCGLYNPNQLWTYGYIFRFNADGTPDITFNDDGFVLEDLLTQSAGFYEITPLSDGGVVGLFQQFQGSDTAVWFGIKKYTASGEADITFGDAGTAHIPVVDGVVSRPMYGIHEQPNGDLVVCGTMDIQFASAFMVARIHADGTLDASFGTNGIASYPIWQTHYSGWTSALQADGRIIVAGYIGLFGQWRFSMARFNGDGNVGIAETTPLEVVVFPNPVVEGATVQWANAGAGRCALELVDLTGRTVLRTTWRGRSTTLSRGDLPSGVYHLCLRDDQGSFAGSMIQLLPR